MDFEFAEEKSHRNFEKHGIDFFEAQLLWLDPKRLEIQACSHSEPRYALIARYGDKIWTAIFTPRAGRIRIISVRRSRHDEEERYHQR